MTTLTFRRKSVCMGDDAGNGEYTIEMPEDATLGDLMHVILHGGNGNDWPIPYTGANSFWLIKSNVGNLADIFTDTTGKWQISYFSYPEATPLEGLGVTWTFGDNEAGAKDRGGVPHVAYKEGYMTGEEIKDFLSDAYSRLGPDDKPVPGPKIMIRKYRKIQDDVRYHVIYNESFFKIMNAETDAMIYYLTYTKTKPSWPGEG